eukprot:GHRR01024409.1.p1 GENE.GHRR01024409.1~~GHRR01024409.1.p1  ORF type:complete len:485 (+),score=160.85 GHRR01024409.1:930-2384(+)
MWTTKPAHSSRGCTTCCKGCHPLLASAQNRAVNVQCSASCTELLIRVACIYAMAEADNTSAFATAQAVLSDLGMLEGKSPGEAGLFTANHMRVVDAQAATLGQGLSFEVFCKLYDMLVTNKARQQLRLRLGVQAEEDLKGVFLSFASFGSREPVDKLDSFHFQKLCRDCGLQGKHLHTTDVDLIFTKVKAKGAHRISFEQFLTALGILAEKKVMALEEVVMQVLEAGGPIAHATKADSVRLHDDKSLYTGVYAHGGPTIIEPQFDLSAYLDRSAAADVRGVVQSTPRSSSSKKVLLVQDGATPDEQHQYASRRVSGASSGTPFMESSDGGFHIPSSRRVSTSSSDLGHSRKGSRRSSSTGGPAPAKRSSLADAIKEATSGSTGNKGSDKTPPPRPPSSKKSAGGRRNSSDLAMGKGLSVTGDPADLKDVFSAFAGFGIHTPPSKKGDSPMFHTTSASPPITVATPRVGTLGRESGKGPEMDGFR